MNRSYSKKRHINESNLKLDERFINEKMVSLSNIPNHPNIDTDKADAAKDNINQDLLNDIQVAAKNAGVKVLINSVISNRNKEENEGRHPSGNAADISMINGKAVNPQNRADVDKFVAELIKLGYVKNQESSNPKAVLTFGFKGHDDHVHVSNISGSEQNTSSSNTSSSTSNTSSSSSSTSTTPSPESEIGKQFLSNVFFGGKR